MVECFKATNVVKHSPPLNGINTTKKMLSFDKKTERKISNFLSRV